MISFQIALGAVFVVAGMQICCCQTPGGCTLMDSCEGCLAGDASLNITDCLWLQCDSGNSSCVWGSEVPEGCSLYNEASLCADAPPPTVPAPVYKQANFDLSSFIGGIILVLGMQSAVFFIVKFLKTKDSTYQTM
ncbi:CD164 sialomucin-like 2 protein isoform X3 [Acipenser oxyrinchus oxyrinchus]|uniref:CD164 sialomucin-like 2 protein isoform X3 n=1 Tax=Acipenser oxyrinchus oxyrinchus TaxID=40147 RepID=A0AAD8FWT7_ACIOX|nr:CD164 sialomucin-like 2 protein isoform X3 [Acipenser oxyrinchus oxyrinchus]